MVVTEKQRNILTNCTAAIVCRDSSEKENTGTAIWFESKNGNHCLLTNAHIIQNKTSMDIYCSEIIDGTRRVSAEPITVQLSKNYYIDSYSDLGLVIIDDLIESLECRKREIDSFYLTENMFLTDYSEIPFLQNVIVVGYPGGLIIRETNSPIFKSGIIAVDPRNVVGGESALVLDLHSFGGSSGSPIFWIKEKDIYLIGIVCSNRYLETNVFDGDKKLESIYINENIGIADCINTFSIKSFLRQHGLEPDRLAKSELT